MDVKTVGVVTSFYNFDPAYSLCAVVKDQLTALQKNGYKTVLCVLVNFTGSENVPKGVEIRKIVPQLILEPYSGTQFPDHWKEDVEKARSSFERNLADADYLLVHDLMFIDSFLPYNRALREVAPKLKAKMFFWTHSAPSGRPNLEDNPHASRFLPVPGKLVYLNHDKANDLAEMYSMWLKDVRVIHNSRDPRTCWNLHPLVESVINKYDLLKADIISTYPVSTPRMISGKGLDKIVKIHSKLKALGYKTKLIVCNAHANAEKDRRMIAETKVWASEMGITQEELIFTSTEDAPTYELAAPQQAVSDFFRLSNVFIFPTTSENSSLILLEAMAAGNLLVLNKKVGTLLEHAGDTAIYMDFEYRDKKDENERYYLDLARIIASQFEVSKPLQAKRLLFQKFNYDKIGKDIETLFFEADAGE